MTVDDSRTLYFTFATQIASRAELFAWSHFAHIAHGLTRVVHGRDVNRIRKMQQPLPALMQLRKASQAKRLPLALKHSSHNGAFGKRAVVATSNRHIVLKRFREKNLFVMRRIVLAALRFVDIAAWKFRQNNRLFWIPRNHRWSFYAARFVFLVNHFKRSRVNQFWIRIAMRSRLISRSFAATRRARNPRMYDCRSIAVASQLVR
ncbi:hypothetical protein FI667_g3546, partial [Globisporangium splendens]